MTNPSLFKNPDLDLSELPSVEQAHYHPLQIGYRSILIISAVIVWGILVFASWIAIPQFDLSLAKSIQLSFAFIIGFLILGLLHLALISRAFKLKGYAVRTKDISYKTGLFFKRHTTVPFSRIQHVEVRQGLLERYFDLAKLNVYTAGGQSSDLTIPGLHHEEANRLKAFIIGTIQHHDEEE